MKHPLTHRTAARMGRVAVLAGGLALWGVAPAFAEYAVQSGDVIEISVAGLPDLKQRSTVGLAGEIAVPMIAPVRVAGLSLPEVQKKIKAELSQKLYQQHASDGREAVTAISPEAVMVSIVEYRPVYLSGDVTKPGAQTYRPGMTVRQAVALAGGYEIMRFRMNNPFLESADLRTEYQTLWMQFVKQQATIWRLQNEMDPSRKGGPSLEQMTQAPLPEAELARVRDIAKQELALRQGQNDAERGHLQKAVTLASSQIDLLKSRQGKDNENVQVDSADYEKLKEFSSRGNVPMTRLSEARRLYLFSATQSLQTEVQLTTTLREKEEAERKVGRFWEDRRKEILSQLAESNVELNRIRSRLQAVGEKITYTGMIRSQLTRGGASNPVIKVYRAASGGGGESVVDEDAEIFPGDTVEVALHTETPLAKLQD
ncbi:polysaccharide biosynthesis/export family protein [Alsobacter sp. KACC 23698]|uniref:Polysaccharide biosynthesis/export family protein n=1 Tax=Alsobacter sp. KACC 23698 TaxID=3149229 RepID=A0AAU7JIV3_9HYPH